MLNNVKNLSAVSKKQIYIILSYIIDGSDSKQRKRNGKET